MELESYCGVRVGMNSINGPITKQENDEKQGEFSIDKF